MTQQADWIKEREEIRARLDRSTYRPEDLHALLSHADQDAAKIERLKGRLDFVEPLAKLRLGMIVEKSAELALREQRISELEAERADLGRTIAEAAHQAGIYNMEVPLTGPMLIMFCDDMSDEILRLRKANEEVSTNGNVVALLLKLIQTGYDFRVLWRYNEWTIQIAAKDFTDKSLVAALEAARQSREDEGNERPNEV